MNRLRLWILGAALGSFAAGMNLGLVAPKLFAAEDHRITGDEAYVRSIAADYGLTSQQETSLRMVMQTWRDEEVSVFRSAAEHSMLPPAIQSQLLAASGRLERRIVAILDEDQRARYRVDTKRQSPK